MRGDGPVGRDGVSAETRRIIEQRQAEQRAGRGRDEHHQAPTRSSELAEPVSMFTAVSPDQYFTATGKLDATRLAAANRAFGPLAMAAHEGEHLFAYEDGVYRPSGENAIRERTLELLRERFYKRSVEEIVEVLRIEARSRGDLIPTRPDSRWINVQNGLLDWRARELRAHTPEVYSTIQVPVRWNPGATCPGIDKFLSEVLVEDCCEEFIFEVVGYLLHLGNPLRRAFLLLGPGSNGKSALLEMLRGLLGRDHVSSQPLQSLTENRFRAAELYGKLANICGDLDSRAVKESDTFKMLTGNSDEVSAERKHAHPFKFVFFGKLVFSANEPPMSRDQTDAYFNRWVIVPMPNVFEDNAKEEARLAALARDPDELEGLMCKAVTGLRRLMARGGFEYPPSVQDARDAYRERLDTVRAFLDEHCHVGPEARVKRSALYQAYVATVKAEGRLPLSAPAFNERMDAIGSKAGAFKQGRTSGIYWWRGVGLREDGERLSW